MTIYLIRHAKAGDRDTWRDDDRLRPLSGRGHRQARLLIDLLHDATVDRVLSSPYVRCMETVVPIAGVRGLPVEPVEALAEGAPLDEALDARSEALRRRARSCACTATSCRCCSITSRRRAPTSPRLGSGPKVACGRSIPTTRAKSCAARYLPPPPD